MKEKNINALNWRYATKIFDPSKKISKENINTILESARLSPSSNGIEMWMSSCIRIRYGYICVKKIIVTIGNI